MLVWNDAWTGCGGYEVQFRRAGVLIWNSIELGSVDTVEIIIPLLDGTVNDPPAYAFRVRLFWGFGNDTKRFLRMV